MWPCLTGCELWTREEGVASLGGTLYPLMSLSDCLKLCLEMSTCVAVDFSQAVCGVHTNISDTAVTFKAPSFTQYTVNRACLSSTLTSVSSTSSAASTETSTPVGKSGTVHTWLFSSETFVGVLRTSAVDRESKRTGNRFIVHILVKSSGNCNFTNKLQFDELKSMFCVSVAACTAKNLC